MKYMKQFGIILLITFIGEMLKKLLPLPIPASIYGIVLMLLVLMTGIVHVDDVQLAGRFLIEIMPMMFIPAAVGIIVTWPVLKPILFPVVIITIVSTILVMGISGRVTQFVNRVDDKNRRTFSKGINKREKNERYNW